MRTPATRIVIAFALVFAAAGPTFVAAQPRQDWRAEVFASAGATGLSRYEDEGFGRHSDFGVGAAFGSFPGSRYKSRWTMSSACRSARQDAWPTTPAPRPQRR